MPKRKIVLEKKIQLKRDIAGYSSVQRMLNRLKAKARARGRDIDKSPTTTLRIFPYFVQMFCECIAGKDPDTLILERKRHLKSDDDFVRRRHEELATKFINELGGYGATSNTIATALGAVRSFYNANYMPLVEVIVPTGVAEKSYRLPFPKDLKGMVESAPLRAATWICCQKDSGIGIGDLLEIRWDYESPVYGTVKEQLKQGMSPIHLFIVRKKVMKFKFDTFFGEDAVTLLNEYADFSRPRIFDISERTARDDVKNAGIVGGTHVLRKFFDTYISVGVATALSVRGQLNAAGLSEYIVEYWKGHSLGKVKGAYRIPPPQLQREIYVEAYPRIKLGVKLR